MSGHVELIFLAQLWITEGFMHTNEHALKQSNDCPSLLNIITYPGHHKIANLLGPTPHSWTQF